MAWALIGLCFLLVLHSQDAGAQSRPLNYVTVFEASGATQVDRVVSIARPFRQGEITGSVQAWIDGTPVATQSDVKNRWPDGSVKFSIVTFVIPSLPLGGSVVVSFVDGRDGEVGGALTQAEMVGPEFDFDGVIRMTAARTQTVSARDMLAAGHWRYWLRGPLVTAVIIEDRSVTRQYDRDFGDGSRALHPIFEAWFYRGSRNVELGYALENTWASSTAEHGMRDLEYGFTLMVGHESPRVEFVQRPFLHIAKSRWHKRFWVGREPGRIRIDHNASYLVTTRAVPHYDTRLRVSERVIAGLYAGWLRAPRTVDGASEGVGNYEKALNSGGASYWIGLLTTWDTVYLLTMDERMREVSLGNADLAGRIPWHFREADARAGTGEYFDAPGNGKVETFGRVISVNARRTVSLWDLGPGSDCGVAFRKDRINTGPAQGEEWQTTRDHMPDTAYLAYLLTGRYYYLEELQYLAAFIVAHRTGCYSGEDAYHRQGHNGFLHDSQLRGDAWGLRTLSYAAFLSPDGTPEKAYFDDKLRNNIALWEGEHDVPLSDPTRKAQWDWGARYGRDSRGPSPLGLWADRGPDFAKSALFREGRVATGASGWEEHFFIAALGMARSFGYPTDGLLRFMAKLRFNLLLNPAANRYLIEAYRWPATLASSRAWVPTYPAFEAAFAAPPTHWPSVGTADHSYGFIALAAMSYLTPYMVDGYRGLDAWNRYKSERPDQDRLASESPKWAIVPEGMPGASSAVGASSAGGRVESARGRGR